MIRPLLVAVAVFAVNVAAAAVVWLYVHEPVGRYEIITRDQNIMRIDTMSGDTEIIRAGPLWRHIPEGHDSSLYRGPTITPTPTLTLNEQKLRLLRGTPAPP